MGGGVVYFIVSLFLSYSRLCLRQVWIVDLSYLSLFSCLLSAVFHSPTSPHSPPFAIDKHDRFRVMLTGSRQGDRWTKHCHC